MCEGAGAAQERWKIVGKRILCTGNAGSGNEIEKARRAGGDFCEALVGGSGRAEKDRVEMVRGENAAIVDGFFRREVGGENAIGACRCGGRCEFFEAHLEDGIVVAEEDERNLGGLADTSNKIQDTGERGAGF